MPTSRRLVTALTKAARAAFSEAKLAHPGEHFYVFALFSESGDDVQPTCNSEEALERMTRKVPGRADERRYLAEEFAYHQVGEAHFDAVTRITASPGDDGLMAARAALANLVREGFFGRGKARNGVAVLVLMSDQSNEHVLEHARKLNPKAVVERLEAFFPVRKPTPHRTTTIGTERVYAIDGLSCSADRRVLAATGAFGSDGIFVWRLGRKPVRVLCDKVAGDAVWSIALSGDGRLLYGCGKRAVLRWDVKTGKPLSPIAVRGDRLHRLALAPGGASLAYASYRGLAKAPWVADQTVAVIDAKTGAERVVAAAQASLLCFSPDDKLLACCGWKTAVATATPGIALLDAGTLEPVRLIVDRNRSFRHLAFAPHGDLLAATLDDEGAGIHIFAVGDGKIRTRITGYTGRASHVAFSPDGAHLAAALDDGILRVWDAATGAAVLQAHGTHESLSAVTFLDARHVAAAGRDVNLGAPVTVWTITSAAA